MIYYIIFNFIKSITGNNLIGLVLFLSLEKRKTGAVTQRIEGLKKTISLKLINRIIHPCPTHVVSI